MFHLKNKVWPEVHHVANRCTWFGSFIADILWANTLTFITAEVNSQSFFPWYYDVWLLFTLSRLFLYRFAGSLGVQMFTFTTVRVAPGKNGGKGSLHCRIPRTASKMHLALMEGENEWGGGCLYSRKPAVINCLGRCALVNRPYRRGATRRNGRRNSGRLTPASDSR